MRLVSYRVALPAVLAGLLIVAPGCGSGGASKRAGTVVHVAERDFAIRAPKRLPAGDVELAVHNKGPDAHELIAVRTPSGRLPLRTDGATIDEAAIEKSEVGALEPADAGVRHMRVRLSPGRYELFCNMAGHYKGGMHVRLVVR